MEIIQYFDIQQVWFGSSIKKKIKAVSKSLILSMVSLFSN